ncbi:hypothetical protein GCM10010466_47210 [Planomonospora alba]|uniref:Uncharacterized protein n=1 Tax=Planomonospora alba TaxID=161354 RepID=A0ABP6NLQ8_9ACTN
MSLADLQKVIEEQHFETLAQYAHSCCAEVKCPELPEAILHDPLRAGGENLMASTGSAFRPRSIR